MSLISLICERAWALEETTLGRLVAIAERAGRAEAVDSPEVAAAIEQNKARRRRIVADRAAAMAMDDDEDGPPTVEEPDPEEEAAIDPFLVGSVMVVPVEGVIASHASMVNGASQPTGTTGAAIIQAVTDAVNDPRCSSIMLDFDSPGGTVAGTEETAAAIGELSGQKPIICYAHGQMCSAAYWIASQGQKVFGGRTSPVGSIGVFSVYDDSSKAMEKYGVTRHIVRSGPNKGTIWPGVPVTEKAIEAKQAEVNGLYAVMLSDVAKGRGKAAQDLAPAADGRVFIGKQAVDAGLLDDVMTYQEAIAWMEEEFGSEAAPATFVPSTRRGSNASAQHPQPTQENDMSGKNPTAPASATAPSPTAPEAPAGATAAAPAAPVKLAATFGELKAAFGGKPGGAELIVEAQEKGLALVDAYALWSSKLEEKIANPPAPAAPAAKPGVAVAPVATFTPADPAAPGGSAGAKPGALATYADAVKAELDAMAKAEPTLDRNKAMPTAMYNAGKKHPALHLAWLEDRCPKIDAA